MKKYPILIALSALTFVGLSGCSCNSNPPDTKYTVSFKNYDGTLLSEIIVAKGETTTYKGVTPTRPETEEYQYTFNGWDQSLENILSDCVRVAQYTETKKIVTTYYTVTFNNYDGSLLYKDTVEEGGTAVYGGVTPTKPETDEYEYEFHGWDQSLAHITSDCVRIAQFTEKKKTIVTTYCTVSFKNYDGTLLAEVIVEKGETATYNGPTPTRPDSADYEYTFNGWDQPLTNITSDCVRVAQYTETKKSTDNYYTVTFKNYDGTVLHEASVKEGETAVYAGITPTRPSTPEFDFTFNGWDQPLTNITSSCVRVAQYIQTNVEYTVKFYSYNNQLLYTDTVYYQQSASYYGPTPTKPSTSTHYYTFKEWDKDITSITKSIEVRPLFDEHGFESLITLKFNNGQNDGALEVTYGESYNLSIPTFSGFNFLGWYINEDTSIPNSGVWSYSGVSTLTAKWESIYFDFAFSGESEYSISLTDEGKLATEIIIPSIINGVPVTSLGADFLRENAKIEKVTIPGSIQNIPNYSFYKCSKLTEVVLNEGLESIGSYAFNTCKLKKLIIPSTCTTIGSNAFDYNNDLYHVYIPSSVTTVGSYAFDVLNSNAYICVEHSSIPSTWQSNWTKATYYLNSIKLVEAEEYNYVIRSVYGDLNVLILRLSALTSEKQNYTFPDEIEGITDIRVGRYLFKGNLFIRNVNFNNVTRIGNYAFDGCTNLKTVTFSDSLTVIGDNAFHNCTSLERLEIPTSVTEIQRMAFDTCSSLAYIYVPKTVTTIGDYAFDVCNKSTIYTNAHTANSGWSSKWKGSQPVYYDFVSLHESDDFNYVKQSYLGDSYITITGLKDNALQKKNLVIPSELEGISDIRLCSGLFVEAKELVSIDVGTGVKTIPYRCFEGCSKLEMVTLHEGITTIGQNAFNNCSSLAYINTPSSLTTIGKCAFDHCTSLREIVIPYNVATIGDYAFDIMGRIAFLIKASTAQEGWSSIWYGNSTTNKRFVYDYVSSGVIDCFRYAKASNGVSDTIYILGLADNATDVNLVVPDEIEGINNIKIIKDAFNGNTLIKTVDLGSSVTFIGTYAFNGAISLRSVIIPTSCTSIKNYAFSNCSNECVINCEAAEKPSGWESNWNSSSCQVVWGYTRT